MTLAEAILEYLGHRITQLENEQLGRAEKIRDLEREKVAIEFAKAEAQIALSRAEAPLPSLNICPHCWIDRGLKSALIPVAMIEGEDVPEDHDIFRCEKRHARGIDCQWYAVLEP